jgi:competence protein ComEC
MLFCDRNIEITASLNALPYFENGRHYYPVSTSYVDGEKQKTSIRIVSASPLDFEPSDEIKVSVKAYLLGKNDSSFVNYYRSRAMVFGGYINKGENAEILKNSNYGITQLLLMLRSKMCQNIMYILPNDYGAVLCSIMLGEKSELSQKAENAFRISGVSHLFAVSGLHLSVWSMLIFDFLKKLRLSNKRASVFSILFCIFFMMLTGLNPPVVRAGFMMILMYASDLFSREADSVNSIGLAVTVMLLFNPYSALSISLWLSLLATFGIITMGRGLTELLVKLAEKAFSIKISKNHSVSYSIISISAISLAVSVFTLPVYVYKFGCISSLVLVSNLLMVSVGTLCMELAGTASVLSLLHLGFLGNPLIIIAGSFSKFLLNTALTLSKFRYALIPVDSLASKICVTVIIVITILFVILKIKNKTLVKAVAFTLAVTFTVINVFAFFTNYNLLRIHINETQSGTSVVMTFKGRSTVLCSGIDNYEQYDLSQSFTSLAVSDVDCIILPDCQYFADAALNKAVKDYNVRNLLVPADCEGSPEAIDSQIGFFENNEINAVPGELTLYINKNAAKAVFFDTDIVILFRNDIILNNSDADIIISPKEITVKSHANGETETSTLAESGGIDISVNKKQEFTYGRAADASA